MTILIILYWEKKDRFLSLKLLLIFLFIGFTDNQINWKLLNQDDWLQTREIIIDIYSKYLRNRKPISLMFWTVAFAVGLVGGFAAVLF